MTFCRQKTTTALAASVLAVLAVIGMSVDVANAQAGAQGRQIMMFDQVPFRSQLDARQERNLCRLQVGEDNWRARWCAALSPDGADQFDACYRKCLRSEAHSRYCDLGSDFGSGAGADIGADVAAFSSRGGRMLAAFGGGANAARELSRLDITQNISERCASVCFDSVQ